MKIDPIPYKDQTKAMSKILQRLRKINMEGWNRRDIEKNKGG